MILQDKAQKILDEAVASGTETSLQFCVYQNNKCLIDAYAGFQDSAGTQKVNSQTLFPIYSTSKGVPATALNQLIERKQLAITTPVREIWPEFAVNGKENTLILHLLNHTSGLQQRFREQATYEQVADEQYMMQVIENSAPSWEPGIKTRYQSLTYGWVTMEIIRRVTGIPFQHYIASELFAPAGISDIHFGLNDETELQTADFQLGHDMKPSSSCSICDPLDELMRQRCIRRAVLPGFNGFASARALAHFYSEILSERYFSNTMLREATTLRRPEKGLPTLQEGVCFGNGYILRGPASDLGRIFGHDGYGGAEAWADQTSYLAVAFTCGTLGKHPCKEKLYQLINFVQRQNWS